MEINEICCRSYATNENTKFNILWNPVLSNTNMTALL